MEHRLDAKIFRIRHFGVVVDGSHIINKYGGGILVKEKIGSGLWVKPTIEKRGGPKCAQFAINRYEAGKKVEGKENTRLDHIPYDLGTSNCQHFANDCYLQQDGKGDCDDAWKELAVYKTIKNVKICAVVGCGIYFINKLFSKSDAETVDQELKKTRETKSDKWSREISKMFDSKKISKITFTKPNAIPYEATNHKDFINHFLAHGDDEDLQVSFINQEEDLVYNWNPKNALDLAELKKKIDEMGIEI
jgi:hypothetical protein